MTYRNQNSINDVGQYQMSGLPFVSSSSIAVAAGTVMVPFPFVTRFVQIRNNTASSTLRVGFTRNGVSRSNFVSVTNTTPFTAELRVKELYVRVGTGTTIAYEVIAGLTTINSGSFPVLTGTATLQSGGLPTTNFEFVYPGLG